MRLFARLMFALASRRAARRGLRDPDPHESHATQDTQEGRRRRRTGLRGETLAYWFLRRQGYTVIARNYRVAHPRGEIDLIAWDSNILAFVEVKTRTTASGGPPEQAVTPDKQQALLRMARDFVARRQLPDTPCRFDILAIEARPGSPPLLRLHKAAFGSQ